MSAIKCTNCNNNDNDQCLSLILYYHHEDIWKCNKCLKTYTNNDIDNILTKINEEIQEANNDLRSLEFLLKKLEKILFKTHFIIIDIKQNIASILRTICMNLFTKPPNDLILKRKIQLCEDLIPIIRKLQPGLSRLTAIALYEYYTPLIDLAQRQYENFEINKNDYLEKLKFSEKILKESTEMLLYEPNRTPEGQLARRALMELKELRETIKDIEKE